MCCIYSLAGKIIWLNVFAFPGLLLFLMGRYITIQETFVTDLRLNVGGFKLPLSHGKNNLIGIECTIWLNCKVSINTLFLYDKHLCLFLLPIIPKFLSFNIAELTGAAIKFTALANRQDLWHGGAQSCEDIKKLIGPGITLSSVPGPTTITKMTTWSQHSQGCGHFSVDGNNQNTKRRPIFIVFFSYSLFCDLIFI